MIFSITYHRPHAHVILPGILQTNDPQHTDWVTPKGWSASDAKLAFEARHPGCTVIRCDEISTSVPCC